MGSLEGRTQERIGSLLLEGARPPYRGERQTLYTILPQNTRIYFISYAYKKKERRLDGVEHALAAGVQQEVVKSGAQVQPVPLVEVVLDLHFCGHAQRKGFLGMVLGTDPALHSCLSCMTGHGGLYRFLVL